MGKMIEEDEAKYRMTSPRTIPPITRLGLIARNVYRTRTLGNYDSWEGRGL